MNTVLEQEISEQIPEPCFTCFILLIPCTIRIMVMIYRVETKRSAGTKTNLCNYYIRLIIQWISYYYKMDDNLISGPYMTLVKVLAFVPSYSLQKRMSLFKDIARIKCSLYPCKHDN